MPFISSLSLFPSIILNSCGCPLIHSAQGKERRWRSGGDGGGGEEFEDQSLVLKLTDMHAFLFLGAIPQDNT